MERLHGTVNGDFQVNTTGSSDRKQCIWDVSALLKIMTSILEARGLKYLVSQVASDITDYILLSHLLVDERQNLNGNNHVFTQHQASPGLITPGWVGYASRSQPVQAQTILTGPNTTIANDHPR